MLSSVVLGLTSAGSFVYPPLFWLAAPGLAYTAAPLLIEGSKTIVQQRKVNTAVLDSIFATAAIASGSYTVLALAAWLWHLGRKLITMTEDHSQKSLVNVFSNPPRRVWVRQGNVDVEIPFEELAVGDILIVSAGDVIPADGRIIEGEGLIDERMLTGESQPIEKGVGEQLFTATLLLSSKLIIEVEQVAAESVATQISQILQATADFRTFASHQWMARVDRFAPGLLGLGVLALPVAGVTGAGAICCAAITYHLRVLAPISMLNFLRITSQSGVLIKDGRSLERLTQVDTLVFDKTGTLTEEIPSIGQIFTVGQLDSAELLIYAASAEQGQSHPIAQAIIQAAHSQNLELFALQEIEIVLGFGIKTVCNGAAIHVGSARFMQTEGIATDAIEQFVAAQQQQGSSVVCIAIDHQLAGAIELQPTIRPEAQRIVQYFHQRGMQTMIISGDHRAPTHAIATQLGIDRYFAETLPENKAQLVEQLQAEGRTVCFIGDGINDSIALKQADVSISMSGAASIAADTAQIVLMDEGLHLVKTVFELAQQYHQNVNRTFMTSASITGFVIGGVFFAGFGLPMTVLLNNLGLGAGFANVMRPMIAAERKTPHSAEHEA